MSKRAVQSLRRYLRQVLDEADLQADALLLRQFIDANDHQAFEILLDRHGPMVLGTARRLVNNASDAADVFQAVFLSLARLAKSIRQGQSVPNWLYTTTCRIAARARKRRAVSIENAPEPSTATTAETDLAWREVRTALDEELQRLPERLRLPLLLCYLSGLTRDEAAEQLGWSISTLKRRLEEGRTALRRGLERRGISAAGLALAVLSPSALDAAVCPALAKSCLDAVSGKEVAVGVSALILTTTTTMKGIAMKAIIVSLALIGMGVGIHAGFGRAAPTVDEKKTEELKATAKRDEGARAEPPAPKDGPQGMKFVPLPKGTFYMGWDGTEGSAKKTEIKEDFEIGVYTVTQGQWQAVMGKNPSWFSRDGAGKDKVKDIKDEDLKQFPVESVSWDDCQEFIKKLNEQEKGKGWVYRLPSEAEWEYACRGGAASEEECSYHFYFAKPTNDLSSKEANFNGNFPFGKADKGPYLERTTKVGSYASNELGLYDMHGNVWQWCADVYDSKKGMEVGASHRLYGGSCWDCRGINCQAADRLADSRSTRSNLLGMRLARVPTALAGNPAFAEPPAPKDGPLGMKFVPLPKATFYMGSITHTRVGRDGKKGVKTEIKADFEIAAYTVTQGQWQELMGNNPSRFSRDGGGKDKVKDIKDEDLKQFPVESVSWDETQRFIKKLNELEKGKGWLYRLPTEAEWEYACRGGATSEEECSYDFYFEKPTNVLSSKEANFNARAADMLKLSYVVGEKGYLERTTKVGSYAPNKLGLYDMHGNVWQWCEDLGGPNASVGYRVCHGGCWGDPNCHAALRGVCPPDVPNPGRLGFRLARVPAPSK
jgi:RNA polymerase sigma factor (sigma-70 family)